MTKVLYISSEAFPLIKTGGLADVAGSLPKALLKQAQDVRLLLPAYKSVLKKIKSKKIISRTSYYGLAVKIIETRLPGTKVIVWLVDCPTLYDRKGGPYSDERGIEWKDNALRFAVLCLTAVDISLNKLSLAWKPGIVHCNDWQSGLVPALLSLHKRKPVTIFTIHNIAYQGLFDHKTFTVLNLPKKLWHMDSLEFYGKMSFIKGGLVYADKITTVSPRYAKEILQAEYSFGLDGLLKYRKKHLSGILNGIDKKNWNPGTDKYIYQKYNRRSLNKKHINKTALQKELKLPVDLATPMFGVVSRLVEQKGFELILQCLAILMTKPIQIVILGTGETRYVLQLNKWAQLYPNKFNIIIGYNEELAHKIEAACDIYLMPSTFEPCGLNQLYSLRYGSLPIVTHVGGLADTVFDCTKANIKKGIANGFILKEKSALALLDAIKTAIGFYENKELWKKLQINAMQVDFSWDTSADKYIQLYNQALKKTK